MNKKRFVVIFVSIFTIFVAVCVYAFQIEPNWIRLTQYSLGKSGANIRIAQLTDLHVEGNADLERVEGALSMLKEQKPDVIVMTGDYFTDYIVKREEYVALLKQIAAIAPTYAVGGNHDGGSWSSKRGGYPTTDSIQKLITDAGIRYLENETDSFRVKNRTLEIYGAGDMWAGYNTHDSEQIFSQNQNSIKVILTHNPDSKFKYMNDKWNLMFCGHTHGGQVVLPFFGAPVLPIENKKYFRGLFEENGQYLIVSAGIGNLHGIRFNSRPEITLTEY